MTGPGRVEARARAGAALRIAEAMAERAAWARLFAHASAGSPFYGPDFLAPLLAMRPVRGLTILAPRDADGEMLALAPIRPRWRAGLPLRLFSTLTGPFIVDGAPLIRAGREVAAWRALLRAARDATGSASLRLSSFHLSGPSWEGLQTATGGAVAIISAHERAMILAGATRKDGGKNGGKGGGKARREMARCLRRLGEEGAVRLDSLTGGPEFEAAREAFLAIEASGWKGAAGTALASRPGSARFARSVFIAQATAPAIRIDRLSLDGRAIAAAVHLVGPAGAVAFKTAYDEAYARRSPGLILDAFALETLEGPSPWTRGLDSGALPGHAVEALWPDRRRIGDVIVALDPRMDVAALEKRAAAERVVDAREMRIKTWIKRRLGRG